LTGSTEPLAETDSGTGQTGADRSHSVDLQVAADQIAEGGAIVHHMNGNPNIATPA